MVQNNNSSNKVLQQVQQVQQFHTTGPYNRYIPCVYTRRVYQACIPGVDLYSKVYRFVSRDLWDNLAYYSVGGELARYDLLELLMLALLRGVWFAITNGHHNSLPHQHQHQSTVYSTRISCPCRSTTNLLGLKCTPWMWAWMSPLVVG